MVSMAFNIFAKPLISRARTLNVKLRSYQISSRRTFTLLKVLHATEKYTIELLPEVEKLLETGEVKHRKHPGIQKTEPISLPETLRTAVDKIISHENERILLEEAKTLCDYLRSRRLPVENDEIDKRVCALVPGFEGKYESLPEVLNKQQLRMLRRRISSVIGRWKPVEYTHSQCLAYLVGRLAANYASVSYVFNQLMNRLPSFMPTSYFDFGCGVGSALWAAHSYWPDTIKDHLCVDASADMLDLCQNILTDEVTEEKHIKTVFFRQFLPASENIKYDLVVSAFSLLDLPTAAERLKVIDTLWRKTKDILVVIEYGTVAGFHCVADTRDYILQVENSSDPEFDCYSSGAHVVSPCPHDFDCPKMMEKLNSSCGFIVPYQVQFPRRHCSLHGPNQGILCTGSIPPCLWSWSIEDCSKCQASSDEVLSSSSYEQSSLLSQTVAKDWISYVILKKSPRPEGDVPQPRLVKPVLKKAKHVYCHLCCKDGKIHDVIVTKAKHGRHVYRCARESEQGDNLPVTVFSLQPMPQQEL